MGQDFTKGLNVCIGNYGYYNEGSLHDAWITLPKTEAEIRDFLHLNQLQDSQHEEIYISDYDGIPFYRSPASAWTSFTDCIVVNCIKPIAETIGCRISQSSTGYRLRFR